MNRHNDPRERSRRGWFGRRSRREPEPAPRGRRGQSPFLALLNGLLTLGLIGAIAGGAALYWGASEFAAPGPLQEDEVVLIPTGGGLRTISSQLEREGVIDRGWLFVAGTMAHQARGQLKAGEYRFPADASMAQVLSIIIEGRSIQHRVTVPEGRTSEQVVAILENHEVLIGEIEETPGEGTLLPETYTFMRGTSRGEIVRRMQAAFDESVAEVWESRQEDLPIESPEELVILASIIEKETGVAEERPEVAAVFINRLRQSMRLQSDPTIIYGIVGGQGSLGRPIRRSEIDEATPYNTYAIDGLPPGPIANPGRASLEAAANPADIDALYFVADGTGGHAFAQTYEEHQSNVARWRAIESERGAGTSEAEEDSVPPEMAEEIAPQ